MSKKASRISILWDGVESRGRDVRFAAYFHHFNRGDYYEAHDVLESLWLEEGRGAKGAAFYQGLIQLAGAFVHLRKHYENPTHPVHQQRLPPAYRLLGLAEANLSGYGAVWQGVKIQDIVGLAQGARSALTQDNFTRNPWSPSLGPRLSLPEEPN